MKVKELEIGVGIGHFPSYTGILATNRQAILDLLDSCIKLQTERGVEPCGFMITMPCGYELQIKNQDDIPSEDLPCGCGRADHYLIRYS